MIACEERLRSERTQLLEVYPLCVTDAISGSLWSKPRLSVVKLLLRYDILDPNARYRVLTDGRGVPNILLLSPRQGPMGSETNEQWFP